MTSTRATFFAFTFALTASATPSFAEVDAQKLAETLKAHMKKYTVELAVTSAETQGDNVVLKGLTVDLAGDETQPKAVGDLTLEGVTDADGGFKVTRIVVPGSKFEDPKGVFEWSGLTINNVSIPKPDEADPVKLYSLYENMELGPIKVSMDGVEVVRMGAGKATISPYAAGQPMTSTASFSDIVVNLATVTDPNMKAFFESSGYKELVSNMNFNGTWNPADGRMTITQYDFDVKDFGKLGFAFDITGYTPELIKQMQTLTQQGAAGGASSAEMGAKMMGMIQGLTINSISMRFDDASITGKALDFASKMMGQPKDALVAQVKGMTPVLAMQAGDPTFATSLATAVSAYMDGPKNFEIKTGAAVPVSVIVGGAMANPLTIVQAFKLQATANQ
jgi:hypothetical protein